MGAGPPPPVHMRPPKPDPPPCGRHKWMAPYVKHTKNVLKLNSMHETQLGSVLRRHN